jgi:5'(3')-deoxyribonucleotidase
MDPTLLIDCDQVLSNFADEVLRVAAARYNVFMTPEELTNENFEVSLGCPHLLRDISEEVLEAEFCYRMKPIVKGIEFLRTLENTYGKKNVFICTAPWGGGDSREKATGEWASQRYQWLRDFAGIQRKRVIMANNKDLVAPQGILVDDSIRHLNNRQYGFCIATPSNTKYKGPRGNYDQCLAWIKEMVG